jgi:lipopolysaccharide O-acetyltransferase
LGAARISVGDGFVAGSHLWLEAIRFHRGVDYRPTIEIGNNVTLGDFVRISANTRIQIGNDVLMGSKIYVADHNHGNYDDDAPSDPRESPHSRPLSSGEPVTVGDRAWIGESVTILPGASVGEGSIIGANSVVASTIPSFAMAVGIPAHVIKQFDVTTKRWRRVEPTDTARR